MAFRRAAMTLLTFLLLSGCGAKPQLGDVNSPDPFLRAIAMEERGDAINAEPIFSALAQQGDCDAQNEMAVFAYFHPNHPDVPTMVDWLQRAADQGQPLAQLTLGDVFYQKAGTVNVGCKVDCGLPPRNLALAYKWYLLGERDVWTSKDRAYAARLLQSIRSDMTAAQAEEGERMAAEWKPSPQACQPRHFFSETR
jgi:TPR repeat protein